MLGLGACLPVVAQCSRSINVPILTSGLTVFAKGRGYGGIVPEYLAQVSEKSGCKFVFQLVPKNRQEALFETGQSDLLLTAVRTARRDLFGTFVPLIQVRATLISVEAGQQAIHTLAELTNKSNLKLVVVRGFDYGESYQRVLEEMQQQGRLLIEADAISVARTMRSQKNYVTIMAPTIFSGMLQTEAKLQDLSSKVRYEILDEISWAESGIYISSKALSDEDRQLLKLHMEKLAAGDLVWKAYQHYYAPEVVRIGVRKRKLH